MRYVISFKGSDPSGYVFTTTLAGGGLSCPSRVQQMLRAIVSLMETNAVGPKVDASRIYLVGFSYGGDGVYALANHYPGEFAAAVPISAGCPHPEYVSDYHRLLSQKS